MKYWVIKAKPENFTPRGKPGDPDRWWAVPIPKDAAKNDRLFVWITKKLEVVQLGSLKRIHEKQERGKRPFVMTLLTRPLPHPLHKSEITSVPELAHAEFLWPSPPKTFYSLSSSQAASLYRLIIQTNPSVPNVWADLLSDEAKLPTVNHRALLSTRRHSATSWTIPSVLLIPLMRTTNLG
jgi:hypothetical protein